MTQFHVVTENHDITPSTQPVPLIVKVHAQIDLNLYSLPVFHAAAGKVNVHPVAEL
jgi:hypothetical protein